MDKSSRYARQTISLPIHSGSVDRPMTLREIKPLTDPRSSKCRAGRVPSAFPSVCALETDCGYSHPILWSRHAPISLANVGCCSYPYRIPRLRTPPPCLNDPLLSQHYISAGHLLPGQMEHVYRATTSRHDPLASISTFRENGANNEAPLVQYPLHRRGSCVSDLI